MIPTGVARGFCTKNDALLDMFANRLLEIFRQGTVDVLQTLGEVLDVT